MLVLKRFIHLEFTLLLRKLYLTIPSFALILYLFYGYDYLGRVHLQGFDFLRTSGFLMMGLTLLAAVIGIVNARQEKVVKMDEVMDSLPAFWIRTSAKPIAWIIYTMVLCAAFSLASLIFIIIDGMGMEKYWLQIIGFIYVNFGFPMVSFWFLGYVVDRCFRPSIGWPILLVLWYITIPFEKGLLNPRLQLMMNQFVEEPYGNRALAHYGLEMNGGLLARKVWFFFSAVAVYILIHLFKNKKIIINKKSIFAAILCFILAISALPLAAVSAKPHSRSTIFNERYYDDKVRKQLYDESVESIKVEEPDFKVKALYIELYHDQDDVLNYRTRVNIENLSCKHIYFTLYRSLEISDIKINDNQWTEYLRMGNWIEFQNIPKGNLDIDMSVRGTLPVSIGEITSKTLMLTPDVPWYPIAGKWKVISPLKNNIGILNDLQPEEPYNISIISNRGEIITNLQAHKGLKFVGKERGPAIIQGDYESERIQGIHFVAPTQFFNFYKSSIFQYLEMVEDEKKKLSELCGANLDNDLQKNYDQLFMVILPTFSVMSMPSNLKSLGSQLYVSYLDFDYIGGFNNISEFYSQKIFRQMANLIFEWFWRSRYELESRIRPEFIWQVFMVAQTGDSGKIEEQFNDILKDIDKDELSEISDIKRIIDAKTKDEKITAAREILVEWTNTQRSSNK